MGFNILCKKDVVEDGILYYKAGKSYLAYRNEDNSIDAESETGEHFGISTIDAFSFDEYFEIENK